MQWNTTLDCLYRVAEPMTTFSGCAQVSSQTELSNPFASGHNDQANILKDEVLDQIANASNVAQFVSFGPDLTQRFSRILGYEPNFRFPDVATAVRKLLQTSPEHKVNIRTFKPKKLMDNPFIRLVGSEHEALAHLKDLSEQGFFTLVNEDIDVNDGGVSGVLLNGIVEFAPGDTPRCVERAEVATLPLHEMKTLIERVYGFMPDLDYSTNLRVEFSIHPDKAGFHQTRTVIWEMQSNHGVVEASLSWPNAFSRWLGDKAFGLLMADIRGFRVPFSVVLARRLPPFSFGTPTHTGMKWVRPAPAVKTPGKFDSDRNVDRKGNRRKWRDPFQSLAEHDPDPTAPLISSLIIQDGVTPAWSGGAVSQTDGTPRIEGRRGFGDVLMVGTAGPTEVPPHVEQAVAKVFWELTPSFGTIRMEWVYDGEEVWLVQLQQEAGLSSGDTIVPGEPASWHYFRVSDGLESLRAFIPTAQKERLGIVLVGNVGLTSHLADILREARVPSKRERKSQQQLALFSEDEQK